MRPLLAACVWVVACDRGARGAPSAAESAPISLARGASISGASGAPPAPSPAPQGNLPSLVRAERWSDARTALEALPPDARAVPDMRFLSARIAFEQGDAAAVLRDLEGLEVKLPELSSQIALYRARAELQVGPFAEAAQYFERRTDTESLLSAAAAYTSAHELPKARLALERALSRLGKSKHTRDAEARARAQRAQLAQQMGDSVVALQDFRWLALAAPLRAEGALAVSVLENAGGASRLSKSERLQRANAFAEAGRVEATEAELTQVARAPGPEVPNGRASYLRAFAAYAARDYSKAAGLFEAAAREEPGQAAKSLFFSARACSRAQADERAIAGYERVSRQFPKSAWAEQAQYLSARLRFIAGEFKKARALYDAYIAQFAKRARFLSDATYERALCALESDQPAAAALSFTRLAERTGERRSKARLRYLAALALALSNQKAKASAAFGKLAEEEPLSFFGLAARARLALVGAPLPPLIQDGPSTSRPALSPTLPPAVATLDHLGLARDAERELIHEEPNVSREYAPRSGEALCNAYGLLGVAQRRYRLGQDIVSGDALDRAPNDTNAWAWRCVYPSPYADLVQNAAQREGLPASLILAVMRQESAFDPSATSPAGACGLLQLIAPTAQRVADSLHEPFQAGALASPDYNVRYGSRYLAKLSAHFGGKWALVAAAYNAGPEAVFRWLAVPDKIGIDAFVARIPFEETRSYVERVLGNLARYQYLEGGAAAVTPLDLELPRAATRPDDLY